MTNLPPVIKISVDKQYFPSVIKVEDKIFKIKD
jgi:hypothetical protein